MNGQFLLQPSVKPIADFLQFSVSFSPFVNSTPYRYVYPACDLSGRHLSSLIQVVKFNERPSIVPHEIQNGLNVHHRALSLINLHAFICKTTSPFQR